MDHVQDYMSSHAAQAWKQGRWESRITVIRLYNWLCGLGHQATTEEIDAFVDQHEKINQLRNLRKDPDWTRPLACEYPEHVGANQPIQPRISNVLDKDSNGDFFRKSHRDGNPIIKGNFLVLPEEDRIAFVCANCRHEIRNNGGTQFRFRSYADAQRVLGAIKGKKERRQAAENFLTAATPSATSAQRTYAVDAKPQNGEENLALEAALCSDFLYSGRVARFEPDRGFGFANIGEKNSVFLHISGAAVVSLRGSELIIRPKGRGDLIDMPMRGDFIVFKSIGTPEQGKAAPAQLWILGSSLFKATISAEKTRETLAKNAK